MSAVKSPTSILELTQLRTLPTGMAESSHLSQAFLTEPEKMDGVMAFAFGTQNENVLSAITGGLGNTRFITNREYKWDLHGQNERVLEVSRDCPDLIGGNAGMAQSTFRVYFAEKLWEVTDVLVSDKGVQARVQSEPYPDGVDWVYTLQLVDPNVTALPAAEVNTTARFSKDYSIVEEFSVKGGGTYFSAPMTLMNQLTTLRKKYSVTRSAATDVMVIELFGPDGNTTKYWTKLLEWTAMAQWYREIDKSLLYSTYNKNAAGLTTLQGENKRPIYTGAGLRQQISPANVRRYSKMTYDLLDDFLLSLSYNAQRWGGNVRFLALTGKMGMRTITDAVLEKYKNYGIVVTDNAAFVDASGTSIEFKQFKTIIFPNGIELVVKEFSPYDDTVRNRTLHPVSGYPIESYRFTIMNIGKGPSGKSNLRKVAKANSDNAMWHVCGSTTPFGDVAKSISTMRSSSIDGYEVHFLAEVGIQLEDPTSCGELIFDVNY